MGRDTLITGIEIVNLKKESIHSVENIYDIVITTPKYMIFFKICNLYKTNKLNCLINKDAYTSLLVMMQCLL